MQRWQSIRSCPLVDSQLELASPVRGTIRAFQRWGTGRRCAIRWEPTVRAFLAILLTLAITVLLASLYSHPANAQVVFDNGATNTIPTDTPDIDDNNGGDGAQVEDSGGGAPTTLVLTTGGTIDVDNNNGNQSVGVRVSNNSIFNFEGGTFNVRDRSGNDNAFGIIIEDSGVVNITGNDSFTVRDADGNDNGNAAGFVVRNDGNLIITSSGVIDRISNAGGSGTTYGVWVDNTGGPDTQLIDISGTFTEIDDGDNNNASGNVFGVRIDNNSQAEVFLRAGSSMTIQDRDNGNAFGIDANGGNNAATVQFAGTLDVTERNGGEATALRAQGMSSFSASGDFDVDEAGGGAAYGVRAQDDAVVSFSGTGTISESGGGAAYGLRAQNNAVIDFTGSILMDDAGSGSGESNGGDAFGARAQNNSVINLDGYLHVDENGGGNQRTIQADNSATINLHTGFSYDASESNAGNKAFITANGSSQVNIFGGELDVGANSGTDPDLEGINVNGNATVNVFGFGFVIDGTEITFDEGTIADVNGESYTGQIATITDIGGGGDFEFDFSGPLSFSGFTVTDEQARNEFDILLDLSGGGSLNLILLPEPSTIAIWTLLGLGCSACGYVRFRRKA